MWLVPVGGLPPEAFCRRGPTADFRMRCDARKRCVGPARLSRCTRRAKEIRWLAWPTSSCKRDRCCRTISTRQLFLKRSGTAGIPRTMPWRPHGMAVCGQSGRRSPFSAACRTAWPESAYPWGFRAWHSMRDPTQESIGVARARASKGFLRGSPGSRADRVLFRHARRLADTDPAHFPASTADSPAVAIAEATRPLVEPPRGSDPDAAIPAVLGRRPILPSYCKAAGKV